jgi:hypothetical protein
MLELGFINSFFGFSLKRISVFTGSVVAAFSLLGVRTAF